MSIIENQKTDLLNSAHKKLHKKLHKKWRVNTLLMCSLFLTMSACSPERKEGGALDGGGALGGAVSTRGSAAGGIGEGGLQAGEGGAEAGEGGAEAGGEAGGEQPPAPPRAGIGVLGYASHALEGVEVEVIGVEADGLNRPSALQINPARPDELWVVNKTDNTVVVFFDVQSEARRSEQFSDPYAIHFLSSPTSISFDPNGQFATCQDSNNGGDYFMGPTLWSSDLEIFARSNPDAVSYLGYDLGSHLDMLHESPYCMGVAWETGNAYWVFEGQTSSIARVDFGEDHGPGFDDHSDGMIIRYAMGEVSRFPGFPSHLVFDHQTGKLFIADTGNRRIGVLDTLQEGAAMIRQPVVEEGTTLLLVDEGPSVETLCPEGLFRGPTGLLMHDGLLYVSDSASSVISAVHPETCEVVDWLDTGVTSPGLMGIAFDQEGNLYAVDGVGNRVLRFSAQP